jgi:hypothetical protein
MEMVRKTLDLVIEAEKTWKAAWDGGIPVGRTDVDGIDSGLATARQLLEHISR